MLSSTVDCRTIGKEQQMHRTHVRRIHRRSPHAEPDPDPEVSSLFKPKFYQKSGQLNLILVIIVIIGNPSYRRAPAQRQMQMPMPRPARRRTGCRRTTVARHRSARPSPPSAPHTTPSEAAAAVGEMVSLLLCKIIYDRLRDL